MSFSVSGQLARNQYKRGFRCTRGARFFSPLSWVLLFMFAMPLSVLAVEDDFRQIEELAASGIPAFALRRLEQVQPEYYRDFESWMRWERLRIGIYRRQDHWAAMLERLQKLPHGLPADFRLWAAIQQIEGYSQLGRNEDAQILLGALLWDRDIIPNDEHLRLFRRHIIALHLASGRLEDARSASRRYRLDYTDDSPAWHLLLARVLLSSGQMEAALAGLAGLDGAAAKALGLIAEINADSSAQATYDRAAKLALQLLPQLRRWFWQEVVAVAGERQAIRLQLLSLEALTALQLLPPKEPSQGLLSAYAGYAEALALAAELSPADAVSLMQYAGERRSHDPLAARALYAHLSVSSTEPGLRHQAHQQLAGLLAGIHAGILLRHLYPINDALPTVVYPALVGHLLDARDLSAVARIFSRWRQPAKGVALYSWQIAWAHFSLHAGKLEDGLALLTRLLEQPPAAPLPERLIGEALDFAGRVPDAGRAFVQAVLMRRGKSEVSPELWFRIGVFFAKIGDDDAAVTAFLPAMVSGADSRLARRSLAAALGRLGVRADAEQIYRTLLKEEPDPLSRVVLEQALFELGTSK